MHSSATLPERDANVIAANQKLRFFPLTVVEASGSEVVDHTGRRFLDLSAAWGANSLGHAHPRVVQAVSTAMAGGAGASVLSASNPHAVALAEALLAATPSVDGSERRVLFGHSGTDANSSAIAAARAATGRPRIIAFEGGYHGGFGSAQAVSGVFVEAGVLGDPASVLLPYPSETANQLGEVWGRLDAELERGDVAAIIAEPMQSDGGIIVPPAGFLRGLAERARAAGALLIIDEVKVGLGRTGKLHAFEHDGVVPDLVTFGKSLGGGLPLSAVVGAAAVLDVAPASSLLTTAGNAVSTAAGLAVLTTVLEENLAGAAQTRGAQLRGLLEESRAECPEIAEVRGKGLSIGIELNAHPGAPHTDADALFTRRVIYRMWQLGVINYLVRDNVIELTPPLTLTAAEARRAADTVERAVRDVREGAVTETEIAPYGGW